MKTRRERVEALKKIDKQVRELHDACGVAANGKAYTMHAPDVEAGEFLVKARHYVHEAEKAMLANGYGVCELVWKEQQ